MYDIDTATRTINLTGRQLRARSFLLGNGAGMVLLAPVELNESDRSIVSNKWFGVSEFGRTYLEVNRVWVKPATGDGHAILLSRANQTAFDQDLTEAVRTFVVDRMTIRERFFVPMEKIAGLIFRLEADQPAAFIVEPQFDMRHYQAFNRDFSGYHATATIENGAASARQVLLVGNRIKAPDGDEMTFHAVISSAGGPAGVELKPETERFLTRVYLKDERRDKLIHKAYREIHDHSPDEAPIWDSYRTTIYAPARIHVEAPAILAFGFDEKHGVAQRYARELVARVTTPGRRASSPEGMWEDPDARALSFLDRAMFQTGNSELDRAYTHVLTRFNAALVARDADLGEQGKGTSAIFAGNKYFLDPWKRDENISLLGLLACNDFETARIILDDTWQKQDDETGRLPQIIQYGQPLVYYASDGTLWALRRLAEYTRMSGDRSLLAEKMEMVERFFGASLKSCRRGLLPSGGVVDESFLWETWQDTAYTPREGYPVEIELLWLTALRDFGPWLSEQGHHLAPAMASTLEEGRRTFELFHSPAAGDRPTYLFDSLDYGFRPRELVTPNGFLAFGLDFDISPDLAEAMVTTGRRHLRGRVGVKSLAEMDWPKVFSEEFLVDPENIRSGEMASVGIYNYHRGIEWLWLNTFMVALELRYGDSDQAYRHYVQGLVRSALGKGGVGGLSELEDLHGPLGADFQAWSMAGFVTAVRGFAGVTVDALGSRIAVCPETPSEWPESRSRHRIGDNLFDVEARTEEDGRRTVSLRHLGERDHRYSQEIGLRLHASDPVPAVNVDGARVEDESKLRRSVAGKPFEGLWVDVSGRREVAVSFGGRSANDRRHGLPSRA